MCTDVSVRRVSVHHQHQHAPTPFNQHSDVLFWHSVFQWPDHTCEMPCPPNYDNTTLLESSNGCWRHTCLETMVLCDIFSQEICLKIILLIAFSRICPSICVSFWDALTFVSFDQKVPFWYTATSHKVHKVTGSKSRSQEQNKHSQVTCLWHCCNYYYYHN